MANIQKLKGYIDKQREKGFSDSEIREKLKSAKYSSKLISEAFAVEKASGKSAPELSTSNLRLIVISVLVVAAIAVASFIFIFRGEKLEVRNETKEEGPLLIDSRSSSFMALCYAAKYHNVSYCDKIGENEQLVGKGDPVADCKYRFYTIQGGIDRNPGLCANIADERAEFCTNTINTILGLIEEGKQPSELCAETGGDLNACLGIMLRDPAYCEQVEGKESRATCYIFSQENLDCSIFKDYIPVTYTGNTTG